MSRLFNESRIVYRGKPIYTGLSVIGWCVLAWIVVGFSILLGWVASLPVVVNGQVIS